LVKVGLATLGDRELVAFFRISN